MDTVSYALSKRYANQIIGTGIKSGTFVPPDIFRFTLDDNSIVNITVANFNNFSLAEKSKLASLDETILSRFSYIGGKLLFDNTPIQGGSVDLTNYYNKLEVDNLLLNKVTVDGTKVLSTNDYTDIEKNKLASTEIKANTIETNLNTHVVDINNPHQVSMEKIIDNNITNPTDGQGLFYNSVTSKWENKTMFAPVTNVDINMLFI
jgi:hypothetical protein